MVTVVGADRPGIVARLTRLLFEGGCNLGEASMTRLGGNFTIMLMVRGVDDETRLTALLTPLTRELGLRVHVDAIEGRLHRHIEPNVQVAVHGADRPGIVAEVTAALAAAGCNILDLNSDVGGTEQAPLYVMIIDGHAPQGAAALEAPLAAVRRKGIEVRLTPLDTLIG